MSKAVLAEKGKRAIADILVGSLGAINGMYIEYGDQPKQDMVVRSKDYFAALGTDAYTRCALTSKTISADGTMTLISTIPWTDKQNVWVTSATLAVLDKKNTAKDTLILTVALDTVVKPTNDGELTVTVTFSL